MWNILKIAAATLTLSVATFGQSNSRRATPRQAEQELIAISRKFVDSAIAKEIVLTTYGLRPTPSGLMDAAEVRGRWDSVVLATPVVRIDGKQAMVTGRVLFYGRPNGGQTMNQSSDVRIWFIRQTDGWKVVNLCLGACSPD